MNEPISYYMAPSVHTIGAEQTLDVAAIKMTEFNIRHLPVLHGGALVGLLSFRDLEVIRAMVDDPAELVVVQEAMTTEVYAVDPEQRASDVFRYMAEHKIGSAVVVESGRVQGVFTSTDALRTLADVFDAEK